MTPSTLTPPSRPEARADQATPAAPHRSPLTAPQHHPTGKVTRRALVLSLGVHLVLGAVFFLIPVVRLPKPPAPAPRDSVQYLDISAFPQSGSGLAGPADLPVPAQAAAPARDTVSARGPAPALSFPVRVPTGLPAPSAGGEAQGADPGVGGAGGTGRAGAAGGRLGAQYGDPRLVVPTPQAVERQLTDEERVQRRVNSRLGMYNDSVAAEVERRQRQRNWTIRDRSGREWGLGEGGTTVIAGRRLPIPLPIPPVPRDRDADNAERERVRRWGEIQDQAQTADRDQEMRRRAAETRRRVDNERRRRRGEAVTDTARRAP